MKSFFSRLHDSTQTGHSKSVPKESYKVWNPPGEPEPEFTQPTNNYGDIPAAYTSTRHHGKERSSSRAPKSSYPLPVLPIDNSSSNNATAGSSTERRHNASSKSNFGIPPPQLPQVYSQGPSKADYTRSRDINDITKDRPTIPPTHGPYYSTRTYTSRDNPTKPSRHGASRSESTPAIAHEIWLPPNIASTSRQTEERSRDPVRPQDMGEPLRKYHSRNEDGVLDTGKRERESERPKERDRDRDRDRVRDRDRGREKDPERDKYRRHRQVRDIDGDQEQEKARERERDLSREREREQQREKEKELQREAERQLAREVEREKERAETERREVEAREKERQERERQERARQERERLEKERQEKDRQERERLERERQAKEQQEKERQDRERQRELAREAREKEKERRERERELAKEADRERERREREREIARQVERDRERERELAKQAELDRERKEHELARQAELERERKERQLAKQAELEQRRKELELAKEREREEAKQAREREEETQAREREAERKARAREEERKAQERERVEAREREIEEERKAREREKEVQLAKEAERERERREREAQREREIQVEREAQRERERQLQRDQEIQRERDLQRQREQLQREQVQLQLLQRERELQQQLAQEAERKASEEKERERYRAREQQKEQERERQLQLAKEAAEKERQLVKDAEKEAELTKERERNRDRERRRYHDRERREREREHERERLRVRVRDPEHAKDKDKEPDFARGSPNTKEAERPPEADPTDMHERQRERPVAQTSRGENGAQEREHHRERDPRTSKEHLRARDRERQSRYRGEVTDGEQDLRRPKYVSAERDKRKEASSGWVSDNYANRPHKPISRTAVSVLQSAQIDEADSSDGSVKRKNASRMLQKRPTDESAANKIIRSRQDKGLENPKTVNPSASTTYVHPKVFPDTPEAPAPSQTLLQFPPRDVHTAERLPQESMTMTNTPTANDTKDTPVRREINRLKLQPRVDALISQSVVTDQPILALASSHSKSQSQRNEQYSHMNEAVPFGPHRSPSRTHIGSNDAETSLNMTSAPPKVVPIFPTTRHPPTIPLPSRSNVNERNDIAAPQPRFERSSEQNSAPTLPLKNEGPIIPEASNTVKSTTLKSQSKVHDHSSVVQDQRPVNVLDVKPIIFPIDARSSSLKHQDVQIPGAHSAGTSLLARVDPTESFRATSSRPKDVRVPPTPAQLVRELPSAGMQQPDIFLQEPAIAPSLFNAQTRKSQNTDSNPTSARHLEQPRPFDTTTEPQTQSSQNIFPIKESPRLLDKDWRNDFADAHRTALLSDSDKIESAIPVQKQDSIPKILHENSNTSHSPGHLTTENPPFTSSPDNGTRPQGNSAQEIFGNSIYPPATKSVMTSRIGTSNQTAIYYGQVVSNSFEEILQSSPISLAEAPSSNSNKENSRVPGADFRSNTVKEEFISEMKGASSSSRPPTSMKLQGVVPGYTSQGQYPAAVRQESSMPVFSEQESPGRRQRNVKLESPYKSEVPIPPTPTRSQTKQDSPGLANRGLSSLAASLPVVPEDTQSAKPYKQESPRTISIAQIQVPNSQPTRSAEDLAVPVRKANSKQNSPSWASSKQVNATPRVTQYELTPDLITKSLINTPAISRYPPSTASKYVTRTLSNQPNILPVDSGTVHRTPLVESFPQEQFLPSHDEAIQSQAPEEIDRNTPSRAHFHVSVPKMTNRNERPSPILNARADDSNKPSPVRALRPHVVQETASPSLGFFTTNFEDALIKALPETPLTSYRNPSNPPEALEQVGVDASRTKAQLINEQTIKTVSSMMKRYELQSNVNDGSTTQIRKPEHIHSRQASTEQYRLRKDSGERIDHSRSYNEATLDDQTADIKPYDEPKPSLSIPQPPKIQHRVLADLLSSPYSPLNNATVTQNEVTPSSMIPDMSRQRKRSLSSSSNKDGIPPSELVKPGALPPENIETTRPADRYPVEMAQKSFVGKEVWIHPTRPSTVQPTLQAEITPPVLSQHSAYEPMTKSIFEPVRDVAAPESQYSPIRPSTVQPQSFSTITRDPSTQAQGVPRRQVSFQKFASDMSQKPSIDPTRNTQLIQDTRSKAVGNPDAQPLADSMQLKENFYRFPTEPSEHIASQRYTSDVLQKPYPQRPYETSRRPSEVNRDVFIVPEPQSSAFRTYSTVQPSSSTSQGREGYQLLDSAYTARRLPFSSAQAQASQASAYPPSLQRENVPRDIPVPIHHGTNPLGSMEPTSSQRRAVPVPIPISRPPTNHHSIRHQHSASLPVTISTGAGVNASSREELPRSAAPAQAHYKMSTLQAAAPVHAPIDNILSLPQAPSEETILLTPSSLAQSMPLKPTTSRQSVTPSVASQASHKGGGFFNIFKKSTTAPSHQPRYEIWRPNAPVKTPDASPKGIQSEPEPDARRTAPLRRASPPPVSTPAPMHGMNQRHPDSIVFTPFKYLTTRRNRAVSVASLEAQDGTAANTVVGSPTASMYSQAPILSPPLRDPWLATEEWRDKEEEELQQRSKAKQRRQRPGVVFDVEEEHPDDKKKRPRRVKTKHRSSSKQTEPSAPGPSHS